MLSKWNGLQQEVREKRWMLWCWYKESVLYPCQTSSSSAMKCWPQYGCCNILPLTCMSCLIIGLGPELTACTVKRWFTVSSTFKGWTRSAANFLLSTQKKGQKTKKKIFLNKKEERLGIEKTQGNSASLWKSILDCEIKKMPWRELGKERTHPPL